MQDTSVAAGKIQAAQAWQPTIFAFISGNRDLKTPA